LTISNSWI